MSSSAGGEKASASAEKLSDLSDEHEQRGATRAASDEEGLSSIAAKVGGSSAERKKAADDFSHSSTPSSSAEMKLRCRVSAVFLDIFLGLFLHYRDFLNSSASVVGGAPAGGTQQQIVRFSFDEEAFVKALFGGSTRPAGAGALPKHLRPPTTAVSTELADMKKFVETVVRTNAWDNFLNCSVVSGSSANIFLNKYTSAVEEEEQTLLKPPEEKGAGATSPHLGLLVGLMGGCYEPRNTLFPPRPAFLCCFGAAADEGLAEKIEKLVRSFPVLPELRCFRDANLNLSPMLSAGLGRRSGLTGGAENKLFEQARNVLLQGPGGGAPNGANNATALVSSGGYSSWKLPNNAVELFTSALSLYQHRLRPQSLFSRVMKNLAREDTIVGLSLVSSRPGGAASRSTVQDVLEPEAATVQEVDSSTSPEKTSSSVPLQSSVVGTPSTFPTLAFGAGEAPLPSVQSERRTENTVLRSDWTLGSGGGGGGQQLYYTTAPRFRIFCCLLGICDVLDANFWQVIQKAVCGSVDGDDVTGTVEISALSSAAVCGKNEKIGLEKIITPTFTLANDPTTSTSHQPSRGGTSTGAGQRRVFPFKAWPFLAKRLEEDDLAEKKAAELKLLAPDLYWNLVVFFSFRVEEVLPGESSRLWSMADLCRAYVDACDTVTPVEAGELSLWEDSEAGSRKPAS